jgi:membrane protease YdiL (CAAX protease family)
MNENAAPAAALVQNSLTLLVLAGSLSAWWLIGWKLITRRPVVRIAPRLRAPWRGLDVLVLAISYLFSEVLAASFARALAGEETTAFFTTFMLLQIGTHVAWLILAAAYLLTRGAYLDDLGWDASRLGEDFKSGALLFLAAVLPVFGVQIFFTQFLGIPSEHPLLELTKDAPTTWIMVLVTVAAVGVAPLFEEFLFRVVLQGWLESEQVRLRKLRDPEASNVPGFAPLVISSFLFAALHAKAGPDPAAIFILSLFLGYAYRQTHRIFPSWIIHTGINGFTMLNMWILYLAGGVK